MAFKIGRRWKLSGLVAAVAAIALLLGQVAASSDTVQPSTSTLTDGGFLNLHFPDAAAPATFTQYEADGNTQTQSITTAPSCGVTFASTPDLADVSAGGGSVGAETSGTKFIGLGVKGKGSSGTNCGRVDPGESLKVSLGTGLAPAGLAAIAAELDIDAKGNALVRADLFNGSNTTAVGVALLSTRSPSGDSGPDATSGDNFAFPINGGMPACGGTLLNPTPRSDSPICGTFAPFTSVKLSTTTQPSGTPSFALEGGRSADPRSTFSWDAYQLRATTADSVFKLVKADGILNCGETSPTFTGSDISTDITRGSNDNCTPIPYNFDLLSHEVDFQKDFGNQTGVNFTWTITWAPEPPPGVPTRIDYTGSDPHEVKWCLADGPDADTNPDIPTGEFWCLVERDEGPLDPATGLIRVTETFYGAGDPKSYH